jgi:hypothetical protein
MPETTGSATFAGVAGFVGSAFSAGDDATGVVPASCANDWHAIINPASVTNISDMRVFKDFPT